MRIAITSAVPGEGKSTVAVELAKAVAKAGHPVTIVEADLHKPVLARRFGLQAECGIIDYLRREKDEGDILYPTGIPSLSLVPAVGSTASPYALLAGPHFQELMTSLEKRCDLVLLDTPPLGLLPDAALLFPLCDGIILVRSRRGDERHQRRMESALAQSETPVIGEIWNEGVAVGGSYYFATGGKTP